MIVDDSADVRFLLRAIIEDSTDEVVLAGEADSARAALEALGDVDPDVVVLDAMMPGLSGIEAAPMILAQRPGQTLLLCSAYVDDELRNRAEAAGIADCVSKDHLEAIPQIALALSRHPGS
jgi:CheY-like chemotaxis protein